MIHQYFVQSLVRYLSVGILLLLSCVISAKRLYAQAEQVARVRAVQIVPDAPPVDVYLDDITPASIAGVSYLDASRSLRLPPGTHNVKIAASGAPKETAVINQNIPFNNDTAYTIFATGRLASLNVLPVILTRWLGLTPTPGRSLVRVMNGSLEAGTVDVTITDVIGAQMEMNGIAFRSGSDYAPFPAGTLEVAIRVSGGAEIYKATGNIPQGALMTIVAVGDPGTSTFKLSVLFDSDSLARSPMDTLRAITANPLGRIRFAHVASDLADLRVALNDEPEVAGISFRDASAAVEHSGGAYRATATLQSGEVQVEKEVDVIADFYQTAFIVGSITSSIADLVVLTTNPGEQPPAGKSSIRLFNAMTDVGIVDVEIQFSDNSKRPVASSGFRNFTPYQAGTPGNTTVRITLVDSTNPVLVATGTIPTGVIGTLILTGTVAQGNLGVNLLIEGDVAAQVPMILFETMTGVESEKEIVSAMEVVPNPARDHATLRVSVDRPMELAYGVYSVTGEKLMAADLGTREAGEHAFRIALEQLPTGSYVIVLLDSAGRLIGARKLEVGR